MIKVSRILYMTASTLFLVGVLIQVFLAGMVVVALKMGWANHRDIGHGMGVPLLLMLLTAYLGRLPRNMKWLTWLLFVVYILQADVLIFLRSSAPTLSAFHPVLALADFTLGIYLAYQMWLMIRQDREQVEMLPAMNKS